MVRYPVRVPRDGYRGRNERLREKQREHNRLASALEKYLNAKIAGCPDPVQSYLYHRIALDLGLFVEDVRQVLFRVDCGHNGFTVVKDPVPLDPGDPFTSS